MSLNWSYSPPGPIAAEFMQSDAFVRGLMGPIGSGKSTACVMEILRRASEQEPNAQGVRRTRAAVIRNTYPELSTTTIKTWHEWMPETIGHWRSQGPPRHFIRAGDMELEVLFLALDSPDSVSKLLSLELTFAWLNECRQIPRAVLDGVTGRIGRFPPKREGGATWSGIIMDTNAPDTDSWYYKLAEENTPPEYEFYRQPGGMASGAENRDNLPERYYERAAAGKDEMWTNVYVHGNYGFVLDGKPVFPEYNDGLHCVDESVKVNSKLPVYVGIDFGLTPACVFAQRNAVGQWMVFDEIVTEDMGAVRFAEVLGARINERYKGLEFEVYGDPAGDQRAQTDERTPFEILRKAGIPAIPAPSNDAVLRREAVAVPLTRLIDGKPGVAVSTECTVLRKGLMGGYCYRRVMMAGSERHHDRPDKNRYSHVVEALEYLMLGAGEGKALVKRHHDQPLWNEAINDYDVFGDGAESYSAPSPY